MKTTSVPQKFQAFLPSSSVDSLDISRDRRYIIENLLKKSNLTGWQWMSNTYSAQEISDVIESSSQLKPKDVVFWTHYLHIPQEKVKCLQLKSRLTPESSWKY